MFVGRPPTARSLVDIRPIFGGRVEKAPWRLNVSRPHPSRAARTSPGLDTLAGARYSTTEYGAVVDHRVRRRRRLPTARSRVDVRRRFVGRPPTARSIVDVRRRFGGRVEKAPWRLNVSRPHPRRAARTSPGLDTLAGARYSTTEYGDVADHRVRRRRRPPSTAPSPT